MPSMIGRRELLDHTRTQLIAGPGVLLYGPAGIGKTTLIDALTPPPGGYVLRCAPAEEDARLPFVGLIDLFAKVPEAYVDGLPPAPRTALRAALLRGRAPVGGRSRLAVRIAVLEALKALAADTGPLYLAIDDLQWLDEPSGEVLAFALRRVEGHAFRLVAAERVPDGEQPTRLGHCPPGTAEIRVPPLPDGELERLLREDSGDRLPESVLQAIRGTAAGNPMYALELGRAVLRDGLPGAPGGPLPVPPRLRALLLDRVRRLPATARHTLLVASAAARPTLTLLHAAGVPDAARDLGSADHLGIAVADAEGTVRFRHPLIRAAVHADAPEHDRRAAHKLLAAAVTEPVEQARHLALAHPHEDETTARTLITAAESARRRGAPGAAAELAELAARRTPQDQPGDRADRLLAAAGYACDAGLRDEAARAAETVLTGAASATHRVRARLVLLGNAGQALDGTARLIDEGLAEATGHPDLEARLHHWAAVRHLLGGRPTRAVVHARRAADRARLAGPAAADTLLAALALLARLQALHGDAAAADRALQDALALLGGREDEPGAWGLIRTGALLAADADRVVDAHEEVAELLARIGEFAGVEETVATLVALTRIQVMGGRCHEALQSAARIARLPAEAGSASPPALYAAALAEMAGGDLDTALRLADRAVLACEADGDQLFLMRALVVLGQVHTLAGGRQSIAAAAEALQRVRRAGESMAIADPALLRCYGDLAEALVVLGETDAAAEVLQAAHRRTSRQTPVSALAALDRAEGLREAALGRAKKGVSRLQAAADRLRQLPLPLDLARTLIALGAVERRSRRRTVARAALTEALRICGEAGAAPLEAKAREELHRLDAMERGGGGGPELTATEQRVAELVGGGATNREVAAELFISIKTVEGTLSRIYRKFGVRSRTALAHAMTVAVLASGAAIAPADLDVDAADRPAISVAADPAARARP
jgi:DNA-binding CsgD family transcriptional regulator